MTIAGLELYAIAIAAFQFQLGLRTDEAKYLLNIPYPHPPLVRWVMGITSGIPAHELLWRIVMATLAVQAVWIIWRTAERLGKPPLLPSALWLASSGLILYGGTVYLSVPTALFGFLFAVLSLDERIRISPVAIGLLWLAALFTAYQGVLYGPLALMALRRRGTSWMESSLMLGGPLFVLGLYTLSNPLALASMAGAAGKDAGQSLGERFSQFGLLFVQGGSILLSIDGLYGLGRSRNVGLLGSFALVSAYILLSYRPYYAILLTPLLVMGCFSLPAFFTEKRAALTTAALCLIIALTWLPPVKENLARSTAHRIHSASVEPDVPIFIAGPFGHEWQYYLSPNPVYRLGTDVPTDQPKILICTEGCDGLEFDRNEEGKIKWHSAELWWLSAESRVTLRTNGAVDED